MLHNLFALGCSSKLLNKVGFLTLFNLHCVLSIALAELHASSVLHSSGHPSRSEQLRSKKWMGAVCLELQSFLAYATLLISSYQLLLWWKHIEAGSGDTGCEHVLSNFASDFALSLNSLLYLRLGITSCWNLGWIQLHIQSPFWFMCLHRRVFA